MGTWIEMADSIKEAKKSLDVVPYVGTWIEIVSFISLNTPPSVVPYVGTWIEILMIFNSSWASVVVPYVGTWIEMALASISASSAIMSFPTWERG